MYACMYVLCMYVFMYVSIYCNSSETRIQGRNESMYCIVILVGNIV